MMREVIRMTYDKNRILDNIDHLVKKQGLQKGKLEDGVGLQVGHLSRLRTKDNSAVISVELLCSIADRLGVAVGDLITLKLYALTATEEYMLNFFNKLKEDTDEDELVWDRESLDDLAAVKLIVATNGNTCRASHPLFVSAKNSEETRFPREPINEFNHHIEYMRFSKEYGPVAIRCDAFNTVINGTDRLYLMPVLLDGVKGYEIYIVPQGKLPIPVFSSFLGSKSEVVAALDNLYAAIQDSMTRTHIRPDAKECLDQYLGLTKVPDDDDIPF